MRWDLGGKRGALESLRRRDEVGRQYDFRWAPHCKEECLKVPKISFEAHAVLTNGFSLFCTVYGSLSKDLLIYLFCKDFQFSWKIAGGPCGLPVVPCGSLGCIFPLGGALRVSKKDPHIGEPNHLLDWGSTVYGV